MVKHSWQRRDLLLFAAFLVVGGSAFFFFAQPLRPARYNGRDAWEWASLLQFPTQVRRDEATAALRAMGTNAVPMLTRRLSEKEPFSRQVRVWLGGHLPGQMGRAFTKNLKPVFYADIRSTAARGLTLLGTNAAAAAPALLKALHDPEREVIWNAASALGEIGEPAVPGLIPLLDDPNYLVRHASVFALGQVGRPALSAAPALVRRVAEKNNEVRASALYTLSRIGQAAGPAVLQLVKESRGEARRAAAKALVAVHPRGHLTLPILVEMATDPEAASRAVAIEALSLLRITHTNAMTVYFAGLTDTNREVRLAASRAIGAAAHKSASATTTLVKLKDNDPDEAVRVAAGAALAEISAIKSTHTVGP